MTAINVLVQSDAVHLISDGATYDRDQILVGVGPKVFSLPHLNAAIGARGQAVAGPLLTDFIARAASSYDDLRANAVSIVRNATTACSSVLGQARDSRLDIVIAGISNATGPDAYMVSNESGDWTLTPIAPIGLLPSTIESEMLLASGLFTTIDSTDPDVFGRFLIEAQRESRLDQGKTFPIGGFAQLTTIDRSGIRTKILQRYDDRIGESLGSSATQVYNGAIANLAVKTLNIGDNAVTVTKVASYDGSAGAGDRCLVSLTVDTTGLAGKAVSIIVIGTIDCFVGASAGSSMSATLFVDYAGSRIGVLSRGIAEPGFKMLPFVAIHDFIATGGPQIFTFGYNIGLNNTTINGSVLSATAAKR